MKPLDFRTLLVILTIILADAAGDNIGLTVTEMLSNLKVYRFTPTSSEHLAILAKLRYLDEQLMFWSGAASLNENIDIITTGITLDRCINKTHQVEMSMEEVYKQVDIVLTKTVDVGQEAKNTSSLDLDSRTNTPKLSKIVPVTPIKSPYFFSSVFYQLYIESHDCILSISGHNETFCKRTTCETNSLVPISKWTFERIEADTYLIRPSSFPSFVLTFSPETLQFVVTYDHGKYTDDSKFKMVWGDIAGDYLNFQVVTISGISLSLAINPKNPCHYLPVKQAIDSIYVELQIKKYKGFEGDFLPPDIKDSELKPAGNKSITEAHIINNSEAEVWIKLEEAITKTKGGVATAEMIKEREHEFKFSIGSTLEFLGLDFNYKNAKANSSKNTTEEETTITVLVGARANILPYTNAKITLMTEISANTPIEVVHPILITKPELVLYKSSYYPITYFTKEEKLKDDLVFEILQQIRNEGNHDAQEIYRCKTSPCVNITTFTEYQFAFEVKTYREAFNITPDADTQDLCRLASFTKE